MYSKNKKILDVVLIVVSRNDHAYIVCQISREIYDIRVSFTLWIKIRSILLLDSSVYNDKYLKIFYNR